MDFKAGDGQVGVVVVGGHIDINGQVYLVVVVAHFDFVEVVVHVLRYLLTAVILERDEGHEGQATKFAKFTV